MTLQECAKQNVKELLLFRNEAEMPDKKPKTYPKAGCCFPRLRIQYGGAMLALVALWLEVCTGE
jgi:hypothetical protein